MTRLIPVLLLLVFCIPPLHAAPSTSVGIFDLNRFLQDSARANAMMKELQQWIEQKQLALDTMTAEIRSIQQQLADPEIGQERQTQLATELQTKTLNLRRFNEDTKAKNAMRREELLRKIESVVGPLIQQVAKREGLQLVLNDVRDGKILFVDEDIDITEQVIKLYDEAR